jgi:hypothetical protein
MVAGYIQVEIYVFNFSNSKMQELKTLILLGCLVLIAQCSPTSIPSHYSLVTKDFLSQRSSPAVDVGALGPPQWQTIDATDAGAPNTQVVMAVIASNTAIVGGLCAIGVVPACITGAILAVLTNFYLVYATTGTTDSPNKRAAEGYNGSAIPMIDAAWAADESCSILCKLKSGAAQNEWIAIGNTTVNGVFHDVLFQHSGNQMGIKAIQRFPGSSLGKRDDIDDDGGYVAAYFWEDNNQQA